VAVATVVLLTVGAAQAKKPRGHEPGTGPPTGSGTIFTHGVASGDVTQSSAILWTRAVYGKPLKAEVFASPSTHGKKAFQSVARADGARDFTVKVDATGLDPGTRYWYRFRHGNRTSPVGTFVTAFGPARPADVRFTYSGDSDTTRVNGVNPFNNWEVLGRAREENGQFFIYLGDTIYSDSSLRQTGPATTLAEYRATYMEQRSYRTLTDLLASTSTYPLMDDHEIHNDYDGQTVDPARYAAGRQAFLEWMPIRETGLPHDPTCAGDPLYRTVRWGSDVELFILDERSCRSADVASACGGDLGPTLPTAVRTTFPFSLFLPPEPPAGCLAAINDPARTMLGPVQKALFKQALLHSGARFKFVVSELAIQQFYALPYDRWEGYGAERSELLNFIRGNSIENVVFLTTDNHGTLLNQVFIDRFSDPQEIAYEMITGPIATNTFQQEVIEVAGLVGLFAFNAILDQVGLDCRHLDRYSYGLVEVAAGDGARVTSKDDTGQPVPHQQAPGVVCSTSFGP
jgi:alkaline phosphatase D